MQVTAPISTVNSSFLAQSKSFDVENGTHFLLWKVILDAIESLWRGK